MIFAAITFVALLVALFLSVFTQSVEPTPVTVMWRTCSCAASMQPPMPTALPSPKKMGLQRPDLGRSRRGERR